MYKILSLFLVTLLLVSCNADKTDSTTSENKIPVYAWTGGPGEATDAELIAKF